MTGALYGIGATDFQAGIDFARMRRERLTRVQAALRRAGIAAALLVRHENLRYALAVRGHAFCPQLSYGLVFAIYRTFVVGRAPSSRERDWYRRCRDRVHAVIDAIRPGATTADAAKGFLPASTWGYDAQEPLVVAEVGHGMGMTYEEPVISRMWSFEHPQPFEPGMVVAVESREGETGYGGVRLEEMVLVTERGHEVLTTWPADEIAAVGAA